MAIAAYLFAHALFLEPGSKRRGFNSLAPYVLLAATWTITYRALGYGTHASGIYINPADEPGGFLAALAARLPVLLLGQIGGPPSDLWLAYPPSIAVAVYRVALLSLGVAVLLLWPLLRRSAVTRFWCVGALLATAPVCATFPTDRLLVFVGLGAMGAVAELLAFLLEVPASQGMRRHAGAPARVGDASRPLDGPGDVLTPSTAAATERRPAAPADGAEPTTARQTRARTR